MFTFKTSLRYVAVLLICACGDNSPTRPDPSPDAGPGQDGGPDSIPDLDAGMASDAPPPDAPQIGPMLERIDWRTTRGPAIATTTVTLPTAELFAMSSAGFITRSACQNTPGCTLTWHDREGAPGRRREHMGSVTSSVLSPDGTRALFVALEEIEVCDDGRVERQVARGVLQVLDVATSETSFELALRTNTWSAPGFTQFNDWFFAAPIEGRACIASATGWRSTAAPFAPPAGLDGAAELVQVVDARRWLAFRGANLGLIDPLTAASFQFLADDPFQFDVTRGWVHVYLGFADLAQDVLSVPPSGAMRLTALRDQDWHSFGAMGRWVRVCRDPQVEGHRDCRVVDTQAEHAPINFRATFAFDHPDDAVLLVDGAVVFVGPLDDGSRAVQRIDLKTGRRETLHAGTGTLRPLGDGGAALLLQDGAAWLIEAAREELVAERVSHVVSVPRGSFLATRAAGRQDDLALLAIAADADQLTLAILDVRTRRLATVSDHVFFPSPRGLPFNFGDGCGQPWTTRHGGNVVEGLSQQPDQLFFVEQGTPATLWLLPIDLSAPPRRLAELTGDPVTCHAPLASPDRSLIGFAENGSDGATTRITLSQRN